MSAPENRFERDGAWIDPMLPAYSDRCRCTGCGEYFASTAAFDRHRRGPFTRRRCRMEWEMIEAGMTRRSSGHWITIPRPPRRWPWNQFPVAPELTSSGVGTKAAPLALRAPA
jgi:hypothetical protein